MERPANEKGDEVEGLAIENIQLLEPSEPAPLPESPCTKLSQCCTRLEGILLMTLASCIFTGTSGVVKYLNYIGPGQMSFIIGVFATLFLVQYAFFHGVSLVRFDVKHLVFIRCGMGSIGYLMKVYAIQNMNYGDAIALFFTGPIWAGVFARLFLKEKYSVVNLISAILGVVGIVLIAKPTFIFGVSEGDSNNPVLATCVAVSGAMVFGAVYCVMSHIGRRVDSAVISTYQSAFMIISGAAFQLVMMTPLAYPDCYNDRVILVITGIGAGLGRICINRALAVEKAGPAALIRY